MLSGASLISFQNSQEVSPKFFGGTCSEKVDIFKSGWAEAYKTNEEEPKLGGSTETFTFSR
jgi:hypothetical protein